MNLHVGSFPLPFRGREKEARLNSGGGGGGQPVRPLHSGLRQTDGSLLLSFATQQVRQRRIAAGPQLFRGTDGRGRRQRFVAWPGFRAVRKDISLGLT